MQFAGRLINKFEKTTKSLILVPILAQMWAPQFFFFLGGGVGGGVRRGVPLLVISTSSKLSSDAIYRKTNATGLRKCSKT